MNEQTLNQAKFTEKFRAQYGEELDWNTYAINRGRGWSKSDGTNGCGIRTTKGIEYVFDGPITRYLPKKYHFTKLELAYGSLPTELFRAWYDKDGKEAAE